MDWKSIEDMMIYETHEMTWEGVVLLMEQATLKVFTRSIILIRTSFALVMAIVRCQSSDAEGISL